jgi:hypothetical protein
MATTNSAQYDKLVVKKLPATPLEAQGRLVPISFKHVVGAGVPANVEATTDTVFLCVIPAGFEVYDLLVFSPSGGFGAATLSIGFAGQAAFFTTAATLTTGRMVLANTAARFRPAVDIPVFLTWAGTPTNGATLVGHFSGVPST